MRRLIEKGLMFGNLIEVTSPAFKDGESIPATYAAEQENISPPLTPVLRCAPANTDTVAHTDAGDCEAPAKGTHS